MANYYSLAIIVFNTADFICAKYHDCKVIVFMCDQDYWDLRRCDTPREALPITYPNHDIIAGNSYAVLMWHCHVS